jgi:hypothetical protein
MTPTLAPAVAKPRTKGTAPNDLRVPLGHVVVVPVVDR